MVISIRSLCGLVHILARISSVRTSSVPCAVISLLLPLEKSDRRLESQPVRLFTISQLLLLNRTYGLTRIERIHATRPASRRRKTARILILIPVQTPPIHQLMSFRDLRIDCKPTPTQRPSSKITDASALERHHRIILKLHRGILRGITPHRQLHISSGIIFDQQLALSQFLPRLFAHDRGHLSYVLHHSQNVHDSVRFDILQICNLDEIILLLNITCLPTRIQMNLRILIEGYLELRLALVILHIRYFQSTPGESVDSPLLQHTIEFVDRLFEECAFDIDSGSVEDGDAEEASFAFCIGPGSDIGLLGYFGPDGPTVGVHVEAGNGCYGLAGGGGSDDGSGR
mmetsp:Transcript_20556/g.41749  ORF Transcript_20556/g.41749 Transcript_20556/m.41749 type:complete len:343 (+) Transcript_20556:478-1506(+)